MRGCTLTMSTPPLCFFLYFRFARALWMPARWGLYAVVALLHAGYALNLIWAAKVMGALRRAMKGHSQTE